MYLTEERYQELLERQLDELLTAEGKSLTKETAVTPEVWNIFHRTTFGLNGEVLPYEPQRCRSPLAVSDV